MSIPLSRFIYVCYASGLLKEGLSLLHWLIMMLMTILCVNTTIIYPIRHAFNGNNFQDIMKGLICNKNISHHMNANTQNDFSNKQTLMILFCASILLGFTSFYFFSARKQRSYSYSFYEYLDKASVSGDFIPSERYKLI